MSSRVEFYYDYASPWSYLANELVASQLAGATLQHRPIYLRGFPQFTQGFPYSGARAQYFIADLRRCTAHWGVPIQFPTTFPVNGLYALRGALHVLAAAPARFADYHQALFHATWRENRDVSAKSVVIDLAAQLGLDRTAFAAGIEDGVIKDQLKQETATAQERGAFGVPSFFVGSELFFGHDRLDYVRRAVGL